MLQNSYFKLRVINII